MEEQDTDPVIEIDREIQLQTLAELQSIRYRLGILVAWLVVIPLVTGLIVWTIISFSQ